MTCYFSKTLQYGCAILAVLFLNACAVYKPDVTQGNIITAEQVAELKLGMSRQQVVQILGSPLLQDVFNSNRWDYVYRFLKGNGRLEQRVLTVFFDNAGKLERWSGLIAPDQKDIVLMPGNKPTTVVNQASAQAEPLVKLNADVLALNTVGASVTPVKAPISVVNEASSTPIVALDLSAPALAAPLTAPARAVTVNAPPIAVAQAASPSNTPTKVSALLSPDINVLIGNKMAAWRSAWMAKDLAAYAAHYAAEYKGDLANHTAWLAQRKRVFDSAGDISITLSDIKVIQTSSTEARAAFTQAYQSTRLTETGTKNLFFQRNGDVWQIVAERFVKQG